MRIIRTAAVVVITVEVHHALSIWIIDSDHNFAKEVREKYLAKMPQSRLMRWGLFIGGELQRRLET